MAEHYAVHPGKIGQRVNVGVERVQKVSAEAVGLCFVKSMAFFEIVLCGAEDFYPHETFFLILSLASSQSEAVTCLPSGRHRGH